MMGRLLREMFPIPPNADPFQVLPPTRAIGEASSSIPAAATPIITDTPHPAWVL